MQEDNTVVLHSTQLQYRQNKTKYKTSIGLSELVKSSRRGFSVVFLNSVCNLVVAKMQLTGRNEATDAK